MEAARRELDSPAAKSHAAAREPEECLADLPKEAGEEIAGRAYESRACYEKLLSRAERAGVKQLPHGRLLLHFRIAASGSVSGERFDETGIDDAEFQNCVLAQFAKDFGHAPSSGCVELALPLRFEPKPSS